MTTAVPMRRTGPGRSRWIALVAVALLLALGVGFGAAQAQDAAVVTHPAHIHVGTCAELDPNPAAPLTSVAPRGYSVEDAAFADDLEDARGALNAAPVETSESTAEIGFDEVLETGHAVNVHASEQDLQTYIACGDIGGVVHDDKLVIALTEQNDSGYFGIAILEPDDDHTKVTIHLGRAVDAGAAEPAETPTPAPEEGEVGDDEGTPVG